MSRRLKFKSVPNSYDGEVLTAALSAVCQPFVIYVQTETDGSAVYVEVPDDCPEDVDDEVGRIVTAHAKTMLDIHREKTLEEARTKQREREQLIALGNLQAQWHHDRSYIGDSRDRILDLICDILRSRKV